MRKMEITDELREWFDRYTMRKDVYDELLAIADRIDAEHEEAIKSVMNDALYHANDKDMADLGWVRMPEGADGKYWFCGDKVMLPDGNVVEIIGIGGDWLYYCVASVAITVFGRIRAHDKCHYKQPTVEDLLRDMHAKLDEVTALYVGEAIDSDERDSDETHIFAEYAAKLRLAGDAE